MGGECCVHVASTPPDLHLDRRTILWAFALRMMATTLRTPHRDVYPIDWDIGLFPIVRYLGWGCRHTITPVGRWRNPPQRYDVGQRPMSSDRQCTGNDRCWS